MNDLFHVSEEAGIARFAPRPSQHAEHPVVWAVHRARLCNYLLPRDCPRVTFYAGEGASAEDVEHLLGAEAAVVAIETAWLPRVLAATLQLYRMPEDGFTLTDAGAGYWTSRNPVVPLGCEAISNLPGAIARAGASLRLLPSLWALHDAVAASSLTFSMIRMRNAAPR